MTHARVSIVDVYVLREQGEGLECLALRRSAAGRYPGAWEAVHGHIEADERPAAAALRELSEETGLTPLRLYNLSRVEVFYQHRLDEVALAPVFVAFVTPDAPLRLGPEHDRAEWLPLAEARRRFAWPRERRALDDISQIFADGGPGPIDDVLRVC